MEGVEIQIEKTNVGLEKKNTGTEFSNRKKLSSESSSVQKKHVIWYVTTPI